MEMLLVVSNGGRRRMKLFNGSRKGFIPVIAGIMIAIPIFLIGIGGFVGVMKFMSSPVVSGSVPMWAIIVVGFAALYVWKNRYKWGLARSRFAPRQPPVQRFQ